MSCERFNEYELGTIGPEEFEEHLQVCTFCQSQVRMDAELMSRARALRQPIQAPHLWEHIEKSLQKEKRGSFVKTAPLFRRKYFLLAPAAALLLMAIAAGFYFGLKAQSSRHPGLIARESLAKVEQKEREYIRAIRDLERQALPKMASLEEDLSYLYRDRLETIDDQIASCQEALAGNPANAHMRRYLLVALQDKKQTLSEILSSEKQVQKTEKKI
jgi:hypothetical protein